MTFQAHAQQFERNGESKGPTEWVMLSDSTGSFISSAGIYTEVEHVTIFDNGSMGAGDAGVVVFPGHNGIGGFTTIAQEEKSLAKSSDTNITVDENTAPGCNVGDKVHAWQAEQSRLLLSELIRQVHYRRSRRNSVTGPIEDGIYGRLLKKVVQSLAGVEEPLVLDALFCKGGYPGSGDVFEMHFWERFLSENAKQLGYPFWILNPVEEKEEDEEPEHCRMQESMQHSQSSTAPFSSMLLDWGIEERHSDIASSTNWDEKIGLPMVWEIVRTYFCAKNSPAATRSGSSIQHRHSKSCTSLSVRSRNTLSRRSCYWEAGMTISSGISVGAGWAEI
ncbi:hypothetical protein NEOLI_002352 [Neolecta irregularis DAH-3]|uniref:Uncharacterized protein n=1 Tax=Neolecta irregularis (strain DAH-3) TaxID=1198029 RepID=A0A1U7LV19_NEOID|nr:hypothetical protein NEOLI_002352 [Neolecta irregularis DAH-3]|eukprot:OLL26469.1 hypothetical protein NEOLI_002352 [Neolecta irregularis DAH-3]